MELANVVLSDPGCEVAADIILGDAEAILVKAAQIRIGTTASFLVSPMRFEVLKRLKD